MNVTPPALCSQISGKQTNFKFPVIFGKMERQLLEQLQNTCPLICILPSAL